MDVVVQDRDFVALQAGSDRQEPPEPPVPTTPDCSPPEPPVPTTPDCNPVVLRAAPAHQTCQVFVVSLGTRTISQVSGSDIAIKLKRKFWQKGNKQRLSVDDLEVLDPEEARAMVVECLGRLPDSVVVDTVDCRRFGGQAGCHHLGFNPKLQAQYLDCNKRMAELSKELIEKGMFPLQYTPGEPGMQRVIAFYDGGGMHCSVAFAALAGAMLWSCYGAEVSLAHPYINDNAVQFNISRPMVRCRRPRTQTQSQTQVRIQPQTQDQISYCIPHA